MWQCPQRQLVGRTVVLRGGRRVDFKGCIVSDTGGFNDKSFNESALNGLTSVKTKLGIQTAQAESTDPDAYAPNLANLASQNAT